MTDKQIIIDGVDVSGCEHCGYDNVCKLKSASNYTVDCKDNPNCYFKQLKRKEQECERLENIINEAKNSKLDLKSFLVGEAVQNEYEQQLDQLKAEKDKYSLFIEKLCDYAGLESDSEEQAMRTLSDLASQMNKARWIIDRYKQTLTEIIEYCTDIKKDHYWGMRIIRFTNEILQKCEVLDE